MASPRLGTSVNRVSGRVRDSYQRDLLHVGAVIARRLQAILGELGGDVFRREIAAALAGAAAFQKIVRQKAHMPANVFGIDGLESDERGTRQLHRRALGRSSGGSPCPGRQAQTHDAETPRQFSPFLAFRFLPRPSGAAC